MSRSKLISYIKHPELLEKLSLEELQSWVAEFPYSQNLRTLLAQKVKSLGKEEDFSEVFHDAALHSTDRVKLYDNLNDEDIVKSSQEKDVIEEEMEESMDIPSPEESSEVVGLSQDVGSISLSATDIPDTHDNEIADVELNEEVVKESVNDDETDVDQEDVSQDVALSSDDDKRVQLGLSDFSQWLIQLEQEDDPGSDEDSEVEVISESLASILADQGHIGQATRMYEKLILKYPEKSTYFAAQIEKLKST